MAGKKQLPPIRLANEDDVPARPKSLAEAVSSGTRLDELIALRLIISAHIGSENILSRDLKSLSVEMRDISREIEGLEARAAEEDAEGADDANGSADARWEPEAI